MPKVSPRVYFNENDPGAAGWLRNLYPRSFVDERSVHAVQPSEIAGYKRVHLFGGIGGWELALSLAGWPIGRAVWTGSCPCRPFSSATRGRNTGAESEEHLWPEMYRLITACRPETIFGEQVAHARAWLDGVCDDLEAVGYAVRACVLPAYCVGADHARERIYFVGHTYRYGEPGLPQYAEMGRLSWGDRFPRRVVPSDGVSRRVAIRGFGNSVVPQVAALWVRSFMEVMEI